MVTHTRLIIAVLVIIFFPAHLSALWVEMEPPTYGAEFEQLVEAADGSLIAVTKWATYRRARPSDAWVPVGDSVHVRDIVFHRAGTLFGCAWDGQDLLRSTNHGATWELVQSYLQTCTFSLSSQSGSIFVAPWVPQGSPQALYRSDDQGLSWIALPDAPSLRGRLNTVTVGDSVLLAAANGTIYRSDDLGETWSETSGLTAALGARSFAVKGDTVFTLGVSWNPPHHVVRSDDAGLTWTNMGETTARNANLCAALGPSGEVFVDGADGRLSSSVDGTSWQPVEPEIRDVCPELIIHSSGTMFARQYSRNVMALEPDGNAWTDASDPINEKHVRLTAGPDDFLYSTWGTAGELDGAHLAPETSHWTRIENPRAIATIDTDGTLYAIDDDVVYRSRDHGMTWVLVRRMDRTIYSITSGLDGRLYAITKEDMIQPGGLVFLDEILVSSDGGSHWAPIPAAPFPDNAEWASLAVGPDGTMYVVTGACYSEFGLSRDGGATWKWFYHDGGCRACYGGNADISSHGQVLLGGACETRYSTDNGFTWTSGGGTIGPDGHLYLGQGNPRTLNRWRGGETPSVEILTGMPFPDQGGWSFVFTRDGSVFVSSESGFYKHAVPNSPAPASPADGATDLPTTLNLEWMWTLGPRYDLQVANDPNFQDIAYHINTPDLGTEFVAPFVGKTYYWRVRAGTYNGPGAWSNVGNFSVGDEGPLAARLRWPEGDALVFYEHERFDWDPAPEAVRYHFQLATDTAMQWLVVDDPSIGSSYFEVLSDTLERSTHYYWRVAGVDSLGRKTYSPTRHFRTTGCESLEYTFTTQEQVDRFPQDCPWLNRITIGPSEDIVDLSGLSVLESIHGDCSDSHCTSVSRISGNASLRNLHGLSGLTSVTGGLSIVDNPTLETLEGLNNLAHPGHDQGTDISLFIGRNPSLKDLSGLAGIEGAIGWLGVVDNANLKSLGNLPNLAYARHLAVVDNPALLDLNGLPNLREAGTIEIVGNDSLKNLDGLRRVKSLNSFEISGNNSLRTLNGPPDLESLGGLLVSENPILEEVTGFARLDSVENVSVSGNFVLASLDGLSSVRSARVINIWDNPSLTDLDDLSGLEQLGSLRVTNNAALAYCSCGLFNCLSGACVAVESIWMDANAPSGDCNNNGADLVPNACSVVSATDVAPSIDLPTEFALHAAYPNPFNPSTTIGFDLPEAANVRLVVFDALGRVVESIVDGRWSAGRHRVTWDARDVPSGAYFARLEAGAFSASRRLVVMK